MNPPRSEDAAATAGPSVPAEPVLAVIDFEPRRSALRTVDVLRYALYAVVIVALAATSAYVAASRGPNVYGARAEILFERRTEQSTGFLREDRDLSTQLVTFKTRAVLGPVAAANGLGIDALAKKVTVGIVDSSEIIRVQVTDRSRARGEKLVAAITHQYLAGAGSPAASATKQFLEKSQAKLDATLDDLTARSAALERLRLGRVTVGNPNPLPTSEQTLVDARITSLLDQRAEVSARLEGATIDFINRPRVAQITKPYTLADAVSPKPLNAAAAGGLAGAVLAVIAVAVLARRRAARRT
jgi:uncharacterized protein involved in exopolysaccharide biosynthesis